MITIRNSNDEQFYVLVTADNGEPLMNSETFTSKTNAINNIKAMMKQFESRDIEVVDETTIPERMISISEDGDVGFIPS